VAGQTIMADHTIIEAAIFVFNRVAIHLMDESPRAARACIESPVFRTEQVQAEE